MNRRMGGAAVIAVIVVLVGILVLRGTGGAGQSVAEPAGSDASASPSRSASAAIATEPVPPAGSLGLERFTVSSTQFGITTKTPPDATVGTIRLDCWPGWRQSNPAPGVYDWTFIDDFVANAEAWGFRDIMLPFCGTPEWAAGPVTDPEAEVLGENTAGPPQDMADWSAFITAVVQRYKGRITSYQVWNEASWPQFFQGTPEQMAEMTQLTSQAVAQYDPDASVVSASVQLFNADVRDWGRRYLEALKALGWPVDVFSFHGYPPTNTSTEARRDLIAGFRQQLGSLDAPALPIWDTELTYKASKPIRGEEAGALVVRSFLDGWRTGVGRTYWYRWTEQFNPFGAIQMSPGTAAARALDNFSTQVIGTTYEGCSQSGEGLVTCRFTEGDAGFSIIWAEKEPVTLERSEPTRYQNLVTGKWDTKAEIPVTGTPVLIEG